MNRAPILPPPPRRRPRWRGGIVLAAALALTACADLLPLLTDAIEVLEARRPDAGAAPIVDAGAPEGGS